MEDRRIFGYLTKTQYRIGKTKTYPRSEDQKFELATLNTHLKSISGIDQQLRFQLRQQVEDFPDLEYMNMGILAIALAMVHFHPDLFRDIKAKKYKPFTEEQSEQMNEYAKRIFKVSPSDDAFEKDVFRYFRYMADHV